MRAAAVFLLLLALKGLSRLFYRYDLGWVGEVPQERRRGERRRGDRWRGHRIAAILNHTSLFEVLWVAAPPPRFLWHIARHGVVPVADVTAQRPWAGRFFHFLARHVVSVSRERDHTWKEVMERIDDPEALVVILPEGRMMRRDGLDKYGKPMTVRGGIADMIEAIPEGRMLLAYSAGLHHVQAPGERWPRLFKTLRMRFECVDLPAYRAAMEAQAGVKGYRRAVVQDLERRRDLYCFPGRAAGAAARAGEAAPPAARDGGGEAAAGPEGREAVWHGEAGPARSGSGEAAGSGEASPVDGPGAAGGRR